MSAVLDRVRGQLDERITRNACAVAGYSVERVDRDGKILVVTDWDIKERRAVLSVFDPLHVDEHCDQLAQRLGIYTDTWKDERGPYVWALRQRSPAVREWYDAHNGDGAAARRRAIVRLASVLMGMV